MKIAELFVRLGADTSGLRRDLTAADRALTKFGGSADRIGSSLRNAFAFAGVGLGVRELTQQADTWKLIESRIRLVTKSQSELKTVQSALFGVAQETRTSFEAVATLYARVARNSAQLGLSQQQVVDFSTAVSKAIKVSGATSSEASAGMVQLAQALASGTLRGDEFRSIMENLPGVAQALAQGLGVPLGALRDMSQAGELTADKVVAAVLKMKGSIDRDFATVPRTVGDAFTTLRNELQRLIGGMDGASGASGAFAGAIVAVSRNLTAIAAVLVGATSTWVAYKVAVYAAAAAHAVVASAATIRAFIQLATTVRSMAGAWALVSAATVGAKAGIVGMLAGMTAAIVAYKAMAKVADEDTQAFTASLQGLGMAAGGVAAPVAAATKNIMETVRGLGEELGKLHLLNGAMGRSEAAKARLLILYDAEAQKRENATKFAGAELIAVNQLADAIARQKLRAHDATAAPDAAKKAWEAMLGTMRDVLSLQGAMKEAGMNTKSVDDQIFAAYQRINAEIARGVGLTNEQLAAAIRLKTELGGAMAPMPGGVGITPNGSPRNPITVKGSNLFNKKDQYGNTIKGQFRVPTAEEMEKTRQAGKGRSWWKGKNSQDSMGSRVGQVLQAGGGGGEMGQMVQAFASFGPMAAILPVINGAMEKLGPAFHKLIEPLVQLGATIGEMLAPVFEMLAPVVSLVASSFKLFHPVLKMIVKGFSYLMEGLGYVVKGLGKLIDALPFVKAKGIIRIGEEMIDAARAARKNTDATDKATDAVEKFAGALSNIPRVLNINALRHMVTGGPPANGGKPWSPPGKPTFGTVTINVNGAGDPRRVAEEVGRAIERASTRGGSSRLGLALA